MELHEFYLDWMADLRAYAGDDHSSLLETFTEVVCGSIEEQGDVNGIELVHFWDKAKGIKVDGYSLQKEFGTLYVFVTAFSLPADPSDDVPTLTQTDLTAEFGRGRAFLSACLAGGSHAAQSTSTPIGGVMADIHDAWAEMQEVRFVVLTSSLLSSRASIPEDEQFDDSTTASYDVWDIGRLHRIAASGKTREDLVIDLTKYSDGGIPCLRASHGDGALDAYLLVVPGQMLADLYRRHGERLLEQNVRTFLQFRGKVNRGIRNTINNEPEKFFPYNNGLSVVAEAVETEDDARRMLSVTNLQVVNGGQTTVSIFATAHKDRADLSKVFVQVKMTVVSGLDSAPMVPRISRYSNTQNTVSAADFFSNHDFHRRMEEISRRILSPSHSDRWYYERVRGQYANAQLSMTPAKRREFQKEYPRAKMFTKTDLAKVALTFEMQPHVVSLGAQKAFARFATSVSDKWDKSNAEFNDLYFRHLCAQVMIFRTFDKLVMKQEWYEGGYKSAIVTYTLALLQKKLEVQGMSIDFNEVWKQQSVSRELVATILALGEAVNAKIQQTEANTKNVLEWCKKELCWQRVSEMELPSSLNGIPQIISGDILKGEEVEEARKIRKDFTKIEALTYAVEQGANYWASMLEWAQTERELSPQDHNLLSAASRIPNWIPKDWQAKKLLDMEERAKDRGFYRE